MRLSSARPSLPVSPKPADTTIAPLTPALAHSSRTSGTVVAGVATTARSTCSGTAAMLGTHAMPKTDLWRGLTGKSARPSERIRFSMMVLPTVPSVSVAPIRAIVLGSSILRI